MKNCLAFVLIIIFVMSFIISGCGETINGISRDFKRMNKGIQTIFIRDKR